MIVLFTKTFDECFTIDGVEMIHMGSHTEVSTVVYVADDWVLFAGDLMFAETLPWADNPLLRNDAWIQAFEVILDIEIEAIF